MHTLKEWEIYFLGKGIDSINATPLLKYIETLNNNGVPVIFDFNHLSLLLGINKETLASIVNSPESYWRSFILKKHTGGYREINVPYPSLQYVQRWIYYNILLQIPVSRYCHGFVKKKSIITNAKWHINQKELLKLDLSNYFPSISINRVIMVFRNIGYNDKVSFYLASLCCLNDSLPQGAPTSPYLSNIVAKPLDYRLIKLAKKKKLHYTRYADDITFSGENISSSLKESIIKIIEKQGFIVNSDKTRLYKRQCKRIITGICVRDKLSLPRDYKRAIKQEIYYIKKYGLLDHLDKTKNKKRKYCASLLGRISFWLQVEPNNEFALNAKNHILRLMRNGFGEY